MAKSGPAPLNDTNKLLAALGYPIGIIALIMVLVDTSKQDKFVKYHAWQALFLWIVAIALGIISAILAVIPIIGWILDILIFLFMLFLFIMAIIWAIKCYGGAYFEIPVVYGWAKKWAEG
ncbi:MAG: DUF4870 domain-containing protein [Actinobacteria bacterium]|nr:DUF4870 domain-containing protein [Actinomycetota bacterium]